MEYRKFIDKVAEVSGIDRASCEELTAGLAAVLEEAVASGSVVSIPSFGSFEPRKRKERIMAHPSEPGKRLLIPPKLVVSFKPSGSLKSKINS